MLLFSFSDYEIRLSIYTSSAFLPLQCLMQLLLDHFAFASASFAFCF